MDKGKPVDTLHVVDGKRVENRTQEQNNTSIYGFMQAFRIHTYILASLVCVVMLVICCENPRVSQGSLWYNAVDRCRCHIMLLVNFELKIFK